MSGSTGSSRETNLVYALAFTWGFVEATVFFIVPDVFLSYVAIVSFSLSFIASLIALAGALLGGSFMYVFGALNPDIAVRTLSYVPAISASMLAEVFNQVQTLGVWGVFLGPLRGNPYKIYSVFWGHLGGAYWKFLLVSIPARYIRFLLAVVVSAGMSQWLGSYGIKRSYQVGLYTMFWVLFYAFYFSVKGF